MYPTEKIVSHDGRQQEGRRSRVACAADRPRHVELHRRDGRRSGHDAEQHLSQPQRVPRECIRTSSGSTVSPVIRALATVPSHRFRLTGSGSRPSPAAVLCPPRAAAQPIVSPSAPVAMVQFFRPSTRLHYDLADGIALRTDLRRRQDTGDRDGAPAGAAGHAAPRRRDRRWRASSTPSRATSRSCSTRASTPSCSATRTTGPTGCDASLADAARDGPRRDRAGATRPAVRRRLPVGRPLRAGGGGRHGRELHPRGHARRATRATWGSGGPTRPRCCASGATLGADDVAVLMNVTPEFASPLGSRPAGVRAQLGGRLDARRRDPGLGPDGRRRARPRGRARGASTRSPASAPVLPQHGRQGREHRARSCRSSTASSSAPTSRSTAAPGTRSTATGCAGSWPRPSDAR